MEVMVAIGILAVSLVAIFNVQGSSIAIASRVKFLTAATLLARSKVVDIEQQLMEEGFSDFAEEMNGDFSEEGWPQFRWYAKISKVKIPVPASMPGDDENTNAYAGMMQGYASMITDLISNALRECNLTVEWGEGDNTEKVALSTHFIEFGRAAMLETPVGAAGGLEQAVKNAESGSQTGADNNLTKTAPQTNTMQNVPLFKSPGGVP